MTFYNFIVDTTTFRLSYSSIQFTVFGRILDEPVSYSRVYYDGTDTFNVDADLDSFKLIVSVMRGYDVDVNELDFTLAKKYKVDYKHFIKQTEDEEEQPQIQAQLQTTESIFKFIDRSKLSDSDISLDSDSDSDKYY